MHIFDLKKIPSIKGRLAFYQLTIDDKPVFEETDTEEKRNKKKNGVLDDYEKELQKKYRKDIEMIYAYMNMHSNGEHIPGTKYHELERPKNDPYPDFEFKHGDLRLYGVKITNGKIIFLGGYKNRQNKNLKRLRSLKKQYFETTKIEQK